jgi:hypothetical protein
MRALPSSRRTLSPAALVPVLAACLLAGGATPATAKKCPNEERRLEQGAPSLPDCRAYELVTPGALISDPRPARAAGGGGALAYYSASPAPSASSSSRFYVARRGPEGWTDISVGPQDVAAALTTEPCEPNAFFSPSLSSNILELGWFDPSDPALCTRPEEIVPGEPFPSRNVFLHDLADGSYELVNVTPQGAIPANAKFQDASDDLGEVVFAEEAQLTPEAPAGYDFYVWSEGVVRLLTILPDGSPASGELVEPTSRPGVLGSGFAPVTGAMSSDGRRAFFYSGGKLYMRENPDQPQSALAAGKCTEPLRGCTVQVDASHGPGAGGGGVFWRATDDGSSVFFTDESRLTPDSTAASGKPDLYRFDVESGTLSDLTVLAGAADVLGVSGIAEDGSYVYFVANGALAPGAQPGDCPGTEEAPGHCSLYVLHQGSIELIATLSGADAGVWQGGGSGGGNPTEKPSVLEANVSPSGRVFAFATSGIFRYRAAAGGEAGDLRCISCLPNPAPIQGGSLLTVGNDGPTALLAMNFASWKLNAVLDDGSVFFSTGTALVPADGNASEDVYEYKAGGVRLISLGDSPTGARFLDASPDGTDVFFETAQSLTQGDSDGQSIYDARVGGGFAPPEPPPPPCDGETCRAPIQPAPAPAEPGTPRTGVKPRRCRRPHRPARCNRHAGRDKHRHRHSKHRRAGR